MHLMQQQQLQHHQLIAQFLQQQQQHDEQQQAFFRSAVSSIHIQVPPNPEQILDSLAGNVKEFRYDADNSVTFAAWYSRYEDLFEKDAARLDDEAKVRLLLRKLGAVEHERYVSFILPKLPKEHTFAQSVAKLKNLFGSKESVISRRYRTLQIAKHPTEDHIAFACRVNKACVEFELGKLSEEQFKCLTYVCRLKAESDAETRTRLLCRIEENNGVPLEQLAEECQRLLNLKLDNAMIESATSFGQVNVIKQRSSDKRFNKRDQPSSKPAANDMRKKPGTPCWFCGAFHYVRDCLFKNHKCSECKQFGHCNSSKKSQCSSRKSKHSVVSKMVVVNVCNVQKRRRFVSVTLDGTQVRLQLDTASDITVISQQIWKKIGSPRLSPATVKVKAASGNILPLDDEFNCDITIGENTRTQIIRVTEKPLQLLGSDVVDSFNLWSIPMDTFCCQVTSTPSTSAILKATYPKVFSEKLGLCNWTKIKFELHQYPLPLPEDIFAKLANCKIFSQIDLSGAFLQVEIDEQYRHLLTINTDSSRRYR
ncbi:uncharacterized protein K02A2.6-like [Topomyia yanbarensis]|uniref:uncharacterized protein K02A2.6-like n=1 Tax=Topomyia yanbarensis TaxID=2498891 RepID=UPI00273A81E0|nr:uncharacterized protein K02A2.6-like [Topomyia yanbarensis]